MQHPLKWLCVVLSCLLSALAQAQTVLRVNPQTVGSLSKQLLDPGLREVIFEPGVYVSAVSIDALQGADEAGHPLLLRAEGEVIFDGSLGVDAAVAHERPGVFAIAYQQIGVEYPKLWEPDTRRRYRLVADLESVACFPATFAVQGDKLYFHTSDGQPPERRLRITHPYLDYGLFISRSHVTVRGIQFHNYLVRDVWSTGVQLRGQHITIEDCAAWNCSQGFTVIGDHNTIRRCRVEDVGCGIYLNGKENSVENCRIFKRRDAFMVSTYAQDDAGVQFYYPAKGGRAVGNLIVGYLRGVFIKAEGAPYVVEGNTIDGLGVGTGFGATKWSAGQQFRRNLLVNVAREIDPLPKPAAGIEQQLGQNCYWSPRRTDVVPLGPGDAVADPKLIAPDRHDYRVANDSPALALQAGALGAVGDAAVEAAPMPERINVQLPAAAAVPATASTQPANALQEQIDRAKPGDTIVLQPGLYTEPITITRGGEPGKPIVLRAARKWRAIFDGNHATDAIIRIVGAAHVELHDIEVRWYGRSGIDVQKSPHVTITGCRVWNAHWYGGWPSGIGINVHYSPHFTGTNNVVFRQEYGFWFSHSPNVTLTHNTAAANLYGAAMFHYSIENSVCRNNSFAYQGNDVLCIIETLGQKAKLATFDCDYNNYGTPIRQVREGEEHDMIEPRPRDRILDMGSKAIINYTEHGGQMHRFVTMQSWREYSGLDRHSIFVDPLYVDAQQRDFRLEPNSPNQGAGSEGATLGALEIVQTSTRMQP
jgi:nitrous oxidase accessory protein NosD